MVVDTDLADTPPALAEKVQLETTRCSKYPYTAYIIPLALMNEQSDTVTFRQLS
jgi:hypothetical protein